MGRIILAATVVFLASAGAFVALVLLPGTAATPANTVSTCTTDIVAHPVNGPWPQCNGLSHADLVKATADAAAQGARG